MEGREREGPQGTVEPGPLRALLRHWALLRFPVFPTGVRDEQRTQYHWCIKMGLQDKAILR